LAELKAAVVIPVERGLVILLDGGQIVSPVGTDRCAEITKFSPHPARFAEASETQKFH
jgi:hypothetical protein